MFSKAIVFPLKLVTEIPLLVLLRWIESSVYFRIWSPESRTYCYQNLSGKLPVLLLFLALPEVTSGKILRGKYFIFVCFLNILSSVPM